MTAAHEPQASPAEPQADAAPDHLALGEPTFTFALRHNDLYEDFCWFDDVFSIDEIDEIQAIAKRLPVKPGSVGLDSGVDPSIRRSEIRWVRPTADNVWLFERITEVIVGCNQGRYGFDLTGIRRLQITEYRSGGFYSWHMDHGKGAHSIRKLSITIQLSEPSEYEGGDMEFLAGTNKIQTAPRGRGTVIVFPSFVMHRITPVTRGTRRSVVAWISGPPYR